MFLVPCSLQQTKSDSSVDAVHYKPTAHCLEHIVKNKAFIEKDEDVLKNDWREERQFSSNFEEHNVELLDMLIEFESMLGGHPRQIKVFEHRSDPIHDEIRLVQSVLTRQDSRQVNFPRWRLIECSPKDDQPGEYRTSSIYCTRY